MTQWPWKQPLTLLKKDTYWPSSASIDLIDVWTVVLTLWAIVTLLTVLTWPDIILTQWNDNEAGESQFGGEGKPWTVIEPILTASREIGNYYAQTAMTFLMYWLTNDIN